MVIREFMRPPAGVSLRKSVRRRGEGAAAAEPAYKAGAAAGSLGNSKPDWLRKVRNKTAWLK
jgi:hypothetical protein